ncbi:hypothetical protein MtrunA17_Chr6g0486621 [Medicago truncatula]|uniref:Uncharacterized protein n=2 Tax=Medicago truncatula TaxID=3880 RepID=A0A396HNR4_MEDTR|nr:hypothetical protein MtrunA17_Chr6g0486621 [Medicago truncatula]
MFQSIKAMDSKENSKVHQEQSTSSSFSCSSLSKQCHMFSTTECNELNNAKAEAESESSVSFTQSKDSYIESGNNALDEEEEDDEVSLNELLLDGKTKKKIELLAAMVGVDTTEPAIVLTEVVRILRVLKSISDY